MKAIWLQKLDSEEEVEKAAPQGDRPFPKWYSQLVAGVDIPNISNKEVPL